VQPRILYVPIFAAFEARPLAERAADWAEIASFDGPGTGSRRDEQPGGSEAMAAAGAERLDELGWDSCVVVCDSHAQASGAELARRDPRVVGLAMGHAALRYEADGPKPTLSPGVHAAATQLLDTDYRSFGRAVTQMTQGSFDDQWVEEFMEEVPPKAARVRFAELVASRELASRLQGADLPLVLARHVGCVMWTSEGFAEAVAALPHAIAVDCNDIPLADPAFHSALRELCARVFG
jgi:hypothetical protein